MRHNSIEAKTGLVFVRDVVGIEQDDRPLRRDRDQGLRRRVRRGVYADEDQWAELSALDRYRARIMAVVRTRRRPPIVGYESAAALWGFPRMDAWPAVQILVDPSSGARSKNGVVVHRETVPAGDVVEREGILLTSPQRTLVDLAKVARLYESVPAIDRALNPHRSQGETLVTKDQLFEVCERTVSPRGIKQALHAIEFGNGLADNAGESASRVVIYELGFPDPVLQVRHANPRGGSYFTDVEWPDYRTIGEFDGLGKYLKEEYLGRMTPGEAVFEEKVREDHLRAEQNAFARWGVDEVRHPARLQAILTAVGLPIVR